MGLNTGLPIYSDIERDLIDPAAKEPKDTDWQPGNTAAHKLFRCVEALRDLDNLLHGLGDLPDSVERRRRVKVALTPLYSLAVCLEDLLDDCLGNRDTRSKLYSADAALVAQLKKLLTAKVPWRKDGALARLRHKTSAHYDKGLSAKEVLSLISMTPLHQLGFWLDVCMSVFFDLLKLGIYFWTCESKHPDVIRLLASEPILASFKLRNGEISEFVGAHVIKRSPRMSMAELGMRIVTQSRWMFRPSDPQIRGFYEQTPGSPWAQALQNLRIES